MNKFEVGETALGCNLRHDPSCNGMECEILNSLTVHLVGTQNNVPCEPYEINGYEVRWANGQESVQEPHELRKRPPKEDARKWFDEKIKLNPKVLEEA